ncbi:hypothetical protein Leryth_003941 [Lithospermum erythrorhizon]|nr:hypothetical protein Leryth_003941 [Lithospermum erythrorhizon]
MARLVSSWYKNVKNMPEEYIFPPDKKPGKFIISAIQQLIKACCKNQFFLRVLFDFKSEEKVVPGSLIPSHTAFYTEELSGVNLLSVNHYPPCPDPTSALGMHSHCDPNLITILHQGTIHGLQVLKDGQWIWAEPLPLALYLATFCLPLLNVVELCKIQRISNPQRYKSYRYKDFIGTYGDKSGNHKEILSPCCKASRIPPYKESTIATVPRFHSISFSSLSSAIK